jgi:hypothetical protein
MVPPQAEVEVEEVLSEGHKFQAMPSQQQIPWKRGRPKKNKEVGGESHILSESCAQSTAKEFLMHIILLEPVRTTS